MNPLASDSISRTLSVDAVVLDVEDGAAPWNRANWVIDGLAFVQKGKLAGQVGQDSGY
jgi:hypothetical protein